jgi:ABC-type Fe3+ transport system permease subunit
MENQFPNEQQPPQFQQPYQQQSYYQPNYAQGQRPMRPDNYLVWAILCTILCCLPLGIVSIIYSSKVDGLYNSGDYAGAEDASKKAKNYAMWGAIISVIGVVLYILFIVVLGFTAAYADGYFN